MKTWNAAAVAFMLLLAGGCATRPSQPDWVAGKSSQYPDAQYLTGRGQAATVEEARDRARADLAKIFEVSVAVESEDVQRFTSGAAAGGPGRYEAEAMRRVSTHADQIVRGIQIAEQWRDPQTQTYHALAVLPRLQAATGLRQEIERLDNATRDYLDQARRTNDLFLKIAAANGAVLAQGEREGYQKSLRIVDPTGRGVEPQWDLAKLDADLGDLLKRVHVATRVPDDSPQGFADVVKGAVAGAGFLADTGDKPDFVLDAKLDMQDLGNQEGWYWQRGTLEVTLAEAGSHRVRGTQRWPIKTSARDRATAARRAIDEADRILRKELRGTVINFATAKPQ